MTTRIGLLGAGWAATVHAMTSSGIPGMEVVWVGSRDPAHAARLAGLGGVGSGGLDELPHGLDLVVVATPPADHERALTRALERGAAVLVEKPLCATPGQADRMIERIQDAGAVVGLAENLLFAPAVDTMIRHRSTLGPLHRLYLSCTQPPPSWGHFLEPLQAGGVLFDLGAHPLALALALAAPARPVATRCRLSSTRADGADDLARVELRFDDGLVAEIDLSWRGTGDPCWEVELAADGGAGRLELLPRPLLELDGVDMTPSPTMDGLADPMLEHLGYAAQLHGIVDACRGRGGRVCPPGFGRLVLEITCASAAAAGSGEEVPLPFDGDRSMTPLQCWRNA